MRLPDDFEEHDTRMTPTVVSAIVAVTCFVGLILAVVLLMNNQTIGRKKHTQHTADNAADSVWGTGQEAAGSQSGLDGLISGSSLSPEDLDFWDKYPEKTQEDEAEPAGQPGDKEQEQIPESDPSTDGKHTRVVNRDGKEEWVLISPYLPKHEYDFTKLVCQSDIMKYYVDGKQASFLGVDISKYQDYVDFVKLKKAGADFVMLRAGNRGYGTGQLVVDDYFTDNLKRATDAGLQAGVYFSSQAVTVEEAVEEANLVLERIVDYQLTYPVVFDMGFVENDTARIEALSKAEKTEIAKAFLDTVAAAGFKTMIRGDKEWLVKEIDMSKLTAYDVWLNQAEDVPDYPYRFTMWQYTSEGSMDGVVGYVGLSVSFIDYAEK